MDQLLSEKDWHRNVGTESYPVSFLHEYAVGVIWDRLHHPLGGSVELPTLEGKSSGDVLAGVDKIIVPDALQSIAGYIPDISLLQDSRPVRCIEVVVTAPPPEQKVAAMQNLGVEVVQVPVRNEEEFCALWPPVPTGKTWWRARSEEGWNRSGGFASLGETQGLADRFVRDLMSNLARCSPELRRAFVAQMDELSSLESLYPIRRDNPKRKVLYPSK